MSEYGICPTCGKDKIYLSKANYLVCGNKICGQIFFPLNSKQHLELRQHLAEAIKTLEKYEYFRQKVEETYLK